MYAVVTTVDILPGAAEQVVALFEETNPALVRDRPDWLGARMLLDRDAHRVTVIAYWRAPESYREMAASPEFRAVMSRFAPHFAGPPQITINEVAIDMTRDNLDV